jgi:hypothetical protein
VEVILNYQRRPPAGRRTGRNIGTPHANEAHDLEDEHEQTKVLMHDARPLGFSMARDGFELRSLPTTCSDFEDPAVLSKFYEEMQGAVRVATGADRVVCFDHTLRVSGGRTLNALGGARAGPALRVHNDYSRASGPARLQRLLDAGTVTWAAAPPARFAFVNVWRNIDRAQPVTRNPLGLCVPSSVDLRDAWPYRMHYPERIGENWSLGNAGAASHRWMHFPAMTADEALIFKVFDSSEAGVRFVFHTAFDHPTTPADAPPRRSIELRTLALWDTPPARPASAL